MDEYTEDYLRELHEAFLLRDKDNSGLIEVQELRPTLKLLGMNPMDKELERITFNCDKDMNNEITFQEFADIVWMLETEEKKTTEGNIKLSLSEVSGGSDPITECLQNICFLSCEKF